MEQVRYSYHNNRAAVGVFETCFERRPSRTTSQKNRSVAVMHTEAEQQQKVMNRVMEEAIKNNLTEEQVIYNSSRATA